MKKWKLRQRILSWKGIVLVSLLGPLVGLFYQLVILGKDSVVLFADTPIVLSLLIIGYYCLLFVFGIVWFFKQLQSYFAIKEALKQSQLNYLKSQVNPHFLFNVLNKLYGEIDKDTNQAKEVVLQLSELLRYGVYKAQAARVSLREEISYCESFIALQRMRYHRSVTVNFEVNIDSDSYEIMPLVFINLLENAFKHGVEKLRKEAYITIVLTASKGQVRFLIKNNVPEETGVYTTGVGLDNLEKRLALVYPDRHEFKICTLENEFIAELILKV